MIKKIIKAVNSVFGNFVRVQSRLRSKKMFTRNQSQTKRNLLYKK